MGRGGNGDKRARKPPPHGTGSERQRAGSPRSRPTWGKRTLLASEAAQAPGLGTLFGTEAAARPTAPPTRLVRSGHGAPPARPARASAALRQPAFPRCPGGARPAGTPPRASTAAPEEQRRPPEPRGWRGHGARGAAGRHRPPRLADRPPGTAPAARPLRFSPRARAGHGGRRRRAGGQRSPSPLPRGDRVSAAPGCPPPS